jgi:hypothetical protein
MDGTLGRDDTLVGPGHVAKELREEQEARRGLRPRVVLLGRDRVVADRRGHLVGLLHPWDARTAFAESLEYRVRRHGLVAAVAWRGDPCGGLELEGARVFEIDAQPLAGRDPLAARDRVGTSGALGGATGNPPSGTGSLVRG